MPASTGSLTIEDLLAVEHQSAADFGLDRIQEVLDADIQAHNDQVQDLVSGLCEITTDRQRIYGSSQEGEMVKVDQFARTGSQRTKPSPSVGFPLERVQYAIGWTNNYFKLATPKDMARATLGAQKAHLKAIVRDIKYAIFRSQNYVFQDFLVDRINLNVKRFANADGQAIPDGPNGEVFSGATHTHYTAAASLVVADILTTIDTVVEHGHGAMVKLNINRANEQAVRALTGFEAYPDPRMALGIANNQPGERLDITRLDNRAIGILGSAEVWVKPWTPAGYTFVYDEDAEERPLALRQRDVVSMQGLTIAAQLDAFPLVAQFMEAEYGIGAWNRTNGAVHQFTNATYQDPW